MMRFAAMLERLPREPWALDAYLQAVEEADRVAALALLDGQRPRRVAGPEALTVWAAEVAKVPAWLLADCLAASGDKAEVAALLLPEAKGEPPTLADVVAALQRATRISAHATMLGLWARLPVAGNLVLNRLAGGTFRVTRPRPPDPVSGARKSLRAVLVAVQPLARTATFALWQDGVAVPVAQLPLALSDAAEVLAWARANTEARFGPVWRVPAVQVFELSFDGVVINRRRLSGVALVNAKVAARVEGEADQLALLQRPPGGFPIPPLAIGSWTDGEPMARPPVE